MMLNGKMIYQNVNCCYECMKGITVAYMHLLDNYRFFFIFFFLLRDIIIAFIIFGPWQMINWNAINYMYYFIVRWLLNLFNVDVISK